MPTSATLLGTSDGDVTILGYDDADVGLSNWLTLSNVPLTLGGENLTLSS